MVNGMKKQIIVMFTCLATCAFPLTTQADIYKHVDKDGHVTYSNVKINGAKKLNLAPANTNFGTSTQKQINSNSKQTSSDFPNVDKNIQQQRDQSRKDILLAELASERQALAAAKTAYDEGAKNPETFRTANGGIGRNVAKYEEKMKQLQADVDVHQRNINLLEKEVLNIN